jgi:NTP pyrophosphatase (non-canonical NTP hydrolase)
MLEGQIRELCSRAYFTNVDKGFHEYRPHFHLPGTGGTERDARHYLSLLALVGTEVAEACEEVRVWNREEFVKELADICIRVFDISAVAGVDLEAAILAKMEQNSSRPYKHGGKIV